MRPNDIPLYNDISKRLIQYQNEIRPLPGLESSGNFQCFILQIIDSIRRIKYIQVIRDKKFDGSVADPYNDAFDPLKAASWHRRKGNIDEAFWLAFLATHFGKNKRSSWELLRHVYRADGKKHLWDWEAICGDYPAFIQWLKLHKDFLQKVGSFGNHRKYENIDAFHSTGTGMIIGSYIDWIGPKHSHEQLIAESIIKCRRADPKALFDYLYRTMHVIRFGRMGKFDYLTMIAKLGLAMLIPPSAYISEATGPKTGCQLLFGGSMKSSITAVQLQIFLDELDLYLKLEFGMQVLEDAICNWQKRPNTFIHFTG